MKKTSYYRDAETKKIRNGRAPKGHMLYSHDDLNYKKPRKGHVVECKMNGDKQRKRGRVTSCGEHGVIIATNKGKKYRVLHHEITSHVGGRDTFITYKMNKSSSVDYSSHLPVLEATIEMLRGMGSENSQLNTYKYRLQALRNRIASGKKVHPQDIRDMNMTIESIGRRIRKKSVFSFGIGKKK